MSVVNYKVEQNVGFVTLNRPEAKNAISPEMAVRLADIWELVKTDDSVRVVVLTATGDVFCAGADLGRLIPLISGNRKPEDEWDDRILTDKTLLDKTLLRTFDVVKPIVAAVNGHGIAGGMEMLQGTDIRVSSPLARFGVQEVKWGIFPAGGSSVRLPRQLPYAKAMELLLTGDLISADEARAYGFVNYVTEHFFEKAVEIANKISHNGPLAVRAIRKSARACLGVKESEALDIEKELSAPIFQTQDAIEGPLAFMEKRRPIFKGK